jgi:Fe-S oxidoreductase
VLFADIFTNYGSPARGLATLKVFQSLGIDVVVSGASADGRAAISQGLIATAAAQAHRTAELLRPYVEEGRDVVVIEPSVLAMFRLDYRRLLTSGDSRLVFELLRDHSFDAVEYLWMFIQGTGQDTAKLFPASRHPLGNRLFYHSHCQQKTIGSAPATEALLRAAGFDVATSQVECCGMAGSFGYKKEYYDLSMAVGQDLFQQVAEAERDGPRVLVATGTSCHEQLQTGLQRPVFYPTELLADIRTPES